jgi:hypothetical protein
VSPREAARLSHRTASQDTENATATTQVTSHIEPMAGADTSVRARDSVVGYVTGGQDRTPLDRLHVAARDGRALMHAGADQVTVIAALVVAAETVGVPRQVAEAVLRRTLQEIG